MEHTSASTVSPAPPYFQSMSSLKKANPQCHNFVMSTLTNKNLTFGEQVLLAKAISDTIVLSPKCLQNFNDWFLQQKGFVQSVVCFVYDQCLGLKEEQIVSITKQFTEWRARIAFRPPSLIFNQGQDYMVDELTGIGLFVDQGTLCAFADSYQTAPALYNGFRQIASHVKGATEENCE